MSTRGRAQRLATPLMTRSPNGGARRVRLAASRLRGGPLLRWYHRADDPYSYLLSQALPEFLAAARVRLEVRTVEAAKPGAMPRADLWGPYALADAAALARRHGLVAPVERPDLESVAHVHRALAPEESQSARYLKLAQEFGIALFAGTPVRVPITSRTPVDARLGRNTALLERRGHYQPGMLEFDGEFFWGLDRLNDLGDILRSHGLGDPRRLEISPTPTPAEADAPIEIFLSVRSPYSYLALEQVEEVGRRTGRRVVERPVLPMVTRGLAVPLAKRLYIVRDTAREARRLGIPFGQIVDPLGRGVSHVLAVYFHVREDHPKLASKFLRSAMRGIWSQGLEVADLGQLRALAVSLGLSEDRVHRALEDAGWEAKVEANRLELESMGLWGVPSFRVGSMVTWGQDRLWRVESTGFDPSLEQRDG